MHVRSLLFLAALAPSLPPAASAQSALPDWTVESNVTKAQMGHSVSSAGDVNGDGFADVIVGAPGVGQPSGAAGAAFVYLGAATGLAAAHSWTASSSPSSSLGYSVACAGDVNGDGFDDVVVGIPKADGGQHLEGRAVLHLGSPAGPGLAPAWTAESNNNFASFGCSVASAGDVNGDGFADVIVGAALFSHDQAWEGRAYLYRGSAAGLTPTHAWFVESNLTDSRFGNSVKAAGDVNGDGFDDVIVGAPQASHSNYKEGRAYVFYGKHGVGLFLTPAWSVSSNLVNAEFGHSVAGAGDVNGDGFADVIVGALKATNGALAEGRAYSYLGSAGGLPSAPAWIVEGGQPNASLGCSVSGAGDVDGDGYSDVILGAQAFDGPGQARVHRGSTSGLATASAWTAKSGQMSSRFGRSVASAGDVDGDGFADVVVGADLFDDGQSDEGRAFLYRGHASALATAYGAGKPGSNGLPALGSINPPVLGGTSDLTLTGGLAGAAPTFLFAGFASAALPFDGGTLLVLPFTTLVLPALSPAGAFSLPVALPSDPILSGSEVYFQAGFIDPGASGPLHTAQTNGLLWRIGG